MSAGPPDDAYGRVSHPQRYAPLHATADELVIGLASRFDVVSETIEPHLAAGNQTVDGHRAVRLTPASPHCAPVSVLWTDFPGLYVRAGHFFSEPFPRCGCDACDEDPVELAADLRRLVDAIALGRLREWADDTRIGFELDFGDGDRRSGWTLDDPTRRPRHVDTFWKAWPLRT